MVRSAALGVSWLIAGITLLTGCGPIEPPAATQRPASALGQPTAASAPSAAGQTTAAGATPGVARSYTHTCYLDEQGHVYCWGYNHQGQVGGDALIVTKPRRVEGVSDVTKIAAGHRATCALRSAGDVVCWGGIPMFNTRTPPTRYGPIDEAVDLAMGPHRLCVVEKSGEVKCGGAFRRHGGAKLQAEGSVTPEDVRPSIAVNASSDHMCVHNRASGGQPRRVQCWRPGSGTGTGTRFAPRGALAGSDAPDVVAMAAGFEGGCAQTSDGVLQCWGERDVNGLRQVDVADVRSFDAADEYACLVTGANEVWCWGDGRYGQLGNGKNNANVFTTKPQRVKNLSATGVFVGYGTTCATKKGGGVACWGNGDLGQLGNGAQNSYARPVRVAAAAGARDIAVSGSEACAVQGERLTCWGGGSHEPRTELLPAVAQVYGSTYDLCALLRSGKVRCRAVRGTSRLAIDDFRWHEVPNMTGVAALGAIPYGGGGSVRGMMLALHHSGKASAFLLGMGPAPYGHSAAIVGVGKAIAAGGSERVGCVMSGGGSVRCFALQDVWYGAAERRTARVVPQELATDATVLEGTCFARRPGHPLTCAALGQDDAGNPVLRSEPERPATVDDLDGSLIAQPTSEIAGAVVLQRATTSPHWCARTQTEVYCWGRNRGGAVGIPELGSALRPVDVKLP